MLAKSRRWIFFLTIVFAAFVTPTQDPFTMLLMAGPMIVLFEGAIQIARVVDKRRARREAVEGFHDIGDDEASPLDAASVRAGRRPYDPTPARLSGTPASRCWSAPPPAAGGRACWPTACWPRFRARRPAAAVLPATTGAEAERQAAEAVATGAGAVVAVGGDGTVHAAVQAVAGTGDAAGRRPGRHRQRPGPGARHPGRRRWPPRGRRPRTSPRAPSAHVDAGRTGDRWWATVLCCGFDSAVSDRANRLRWPKGRRRYDVAVLAELARLRPVELTMVLDGEAQTLPVTLVAVGNTPWYGGGMKVCPGADPH